MGRRKGERGRHHVGWTRDGLGGPGTTDAGFKLLAKGSILSRRLKRLAEP
jgi:hypothetical protein